MTMKDMKCDVCSVGDAIGVASCHAPVSVAFCKECASRGTDPEFVFEVWKEDGIKPEDMGAPDLLNTFKDGKYMTYREWYNV